jgi:DNA-directed RNA polymerase specialized sigma24 family protein
VDRRAHRRTTFEKPAQRAGVVSRLQSRTMGQARNTMNLQTLSQADYNRLLRYVQKVVPPQLCAAEEALSEGLIAALRTYDPVKSSLPVYVARCALNYARWQARKWSQVEMLSELEDEHGEINQLADDDPRYVEAIPEPFIERIEEILEQSQDYRNRRTRP